MVITYLESTVVGKQFQINSIKLGLGCYGRNPQADANMPQQLLLDYKGEEDAQNARVMRIKNAAILHRQWPMPPERRVAGPSHFW